MNIENDIYQTLEQIVNKNYAIQTGVALDENSQQEKDNAMRITNNCCDMVVEQTSELELNKALLQAYRDKRKPE